MELFAMFAKVVAKTGQRQTLVEHLLEAAHLLTALPGCLLYVVNVSPSEPDLVCVFEAWRSEADHDASLKLDSVKTVIARTKPLVAGFEGARLVPVGGKGLPPA
jgi:quinol monooxygenase YgiN